MDMIIGDQKRIKVGTSVQRVRFIFLPDDKVGAKMWMGHQDESDALNAGPYLCTVYHKMRPLAVPSANIVSRG